MIIHSFQEPDYPFKWLLEIFCFQLFLFSSLYINCILALAIFLDAQAGFSTYVSAPGIVQQISSLHSDLMALQSDLENSLPEDRNRCINELWVILFCLRTILHYFLTGKLHTHLLGLEPTIPFSTFLKSFDYDWERIDELLLLYDTIGDSMDSWL